MTYFTLEQAHALLPQVGASLAEARELKRRQDSILLEWRAGPSNDAADAAIRRGQVEFLLKEIQLRLKGICRLGALPKDVELGLVDFPAYLPGVGEVYYCWRLGESSIDHWHYTHEGYSSRKALPSPRTAPWS